MSEPIDNKSFVLPSIEYDVVDHCNLNCKGCGHLSPINQPYFASVESFRNDLLQLRKNNIGVERVRFLGGEPLLHPEISEFVKAAREVFSDSSVEIITNGILLPKMDDLFWTDCNENRAQIFITKYPLNFDYNQAVALSQRHGVEISLSETNNYFKKVLNKDKKYDSRENFFLCQSMYRCAYLRDGKLFVCAGGYLLPLINQHFQTEFPVGSSDFFDIYKDNFAVEQLIGFFNTYKEHCGWCQLPHEEGSYQWTSSNKNKDEWIID